MLRRTIALIIAGLIAAAPAWATDETSKRESGIEHAARKTGAAIDRAAHKAWHGVKKAAVKTGEALQKAGRKTAKWIDEKTS